MRRIGITSAGGAAPVSERPGPLLARALAALLCFLLLVAQPVCRSFATEGFAAGESAFEAGDYTRAYRIWYALAAEGDGRAQYGIGLLYDRGLTGSGRSAEQAAFWYRRAADQGVNEARNNLALLYASGQGVEARPEASLELWRSAAKAGHLAALTNLALAHLYGIGTEPDPMEARRWYERAADAGDANAAFALARLLESGAPGMEADARAAARRYSQAAEFGHPQALARLERLRPRPEEPPPSVEGDTPRSGGIFFAQIDAFADSVQALRSLDRLPAPMSDAWRHGGGTYVQRSWIGGRELYRAQLGPFASYNRADALCGELLAAGSACIVITTPLQ